MPTIEFSASEVCAEILDSFPALWQVLTRRALSKMIQRAVQPSVPVSSQFEKQLKWCYRNFGIPNSQRAEPDSSCVSLVPSFVFRCYDCQFLSTWCEVACCQRFLPTALYLQLRSPTHGMHCKGFSINLTFQCFSFAFGTRWHYFNHCFCAVHFEHQWTLHPLVKLMASPLNKLPIKRTCLESLLTLITHCSKLLNAA